MTTVRRATPLRRKQFPRGGSGRTILRFLLLAGVAILNPTGAAEPVRPPANTNSPAPPQAEAPAAKPEETSAKEETPAELTPEQMFEGGEKTYANWVEVSAGGMLTDGDRGQAEQRQQVSEGAFGGIQDLHLEQALDKKTTLTLDGHSLFGNYDHALSLGVRREGLGYVRFSFENFRTWYDSSGGYFPPDDIHYSISDEALGLDRGEISFETGLTLEKIPQLTFNYTRRYRDGEKSSTIWGPVQTSRGLRALYPGFYDIDEESDAFELDARHKIKATQIGVGVRYETGELDNALKTTFQPGESAAERHLTDRQETSYDLFNVHAFTESWIKTNLLFSTGFIFTDLDNSFTGSRIYGEDYDVNYAPNSLNGLGYFDLNGGSRQQEYVLNVNLMSLPLRHLAIVPSLRVQKNDWDADASGLGALGDAPAEPFSSESQRDFLEVRERLDLRYTGLTNWVLYAGPEWTQGSGDLEERGGLSRINGIGVAPVDRTTDDSQFHQKYFAGARWYPTRRVTLDVGGYYKLNSYEYDHQSDSTLNRVGSPDRYPAFLTMQDFETYDGNLRLTLRPAQRITLVSRYEYQFSTVSTTPDPAASLGEVDASEITSHIFAQNISWIPWTRLNLQLGFNWVVSETETPTSDFTEAVLNAQNNYWTVNFNSGMVLDNKTDLNLGYFYYCSDNFDDNSDQGLPLGAASEEHGITATLVRRLAHNLRLTLRYGFSHFRDTASNDRDSYEAHLIYSSLQYRF